MTYEKLIEQMLDATTQNQGNYEILNTEPSWLKSNTRIDYITILDASSYDKEQNHYHEQMVFEVKDFLNKNGQDVFFEDAQKACFEAAMKYAKTCQSPIFNIEGRKGFMFNARI